jgi:glycosyltransferase involved in cell wall biosynthesis
MSHTISANIIVKNESKHIRKCLESVSDVCQQIVVIDTGSKDTTNTIATQCGADLYFYEWQNDFAAARNFGIKHCYCDWILSIDADEQLVTKTIDIDWLIRTLENSSIGGISVTLNNFLDSNLQTAKQHHFTRIFRKHHNINFTGKIHEQISESIIGSGLQIIDSNITFNHYGYIDKNVAKEQRNKIMLENELASNNDVFTKYHLANTNFAMENYNEAEKLFSDVLAASGLTPLQQEDSRIKLAQIFLSHNDFQKVIDTLQFNCNDVDNEGLRLSIIAAAEMNLHHFTQAKMLYQQPEVIQSRLVSKETIINAQRVFEMLHI